MRGGQEKEKRRGNPAAFLRLTGREEGGPVDRVIFHCDLNAFYASVELLSYPELREKPVAVCGDPAARHGIILAKNEAAKEGHEF